MKTSVQASRITSARLSAIFQVPFPVKTYLLILDSSYRLGLIVLNGSALIGWYLESDLDLTKTTISGCPTRILLLKKLKR